MAHALLYVKSGTLRQRNRTLLYAAASLVLIFGSQTSVTAQTGSIYRLPAGTRIRLRLDAELSTLSASVDDTFLAFVASPVLVREAVMLPEGTVVEGRVIGVRHPGAGGRSGRLDLAFETLRLSGETRRIDGSIVKPPSESHASLSAVSVGAGTAAGAVVGGLTRSGTGAVIGAAAGAGIGIIASLFRKGPEGRIRRDEVFEIELRSPVTLPVTDY
jgi:hypothetical protein